MKFHLRPTGYNSKISYDATFANIPVLIKGTGILRYCVEYHSFHPGRIYIQMSTLEILKSTHFRYR